MQRGNTYAKSLHTNDNMTFIQLISNSMPIKKNVLFRALTNLFGLHKRPFNTEFYFNIGSFRCNSSLAFTVSIPVPFKNPKDVPTISKQLYVRLY